MINKETLLDCKQLKERLYYDSETGFFTWREKKVKKYQDKAFNTLRAWRRAGSIIKDDRTFNYRRVYITMQIDKKHYYFYGHRLAWLYMTGNWPADHIDHIDGDGANNKWSNLRNVTRQDNQRNIKVNKNSESGFTGVAWNKNTQKWRVRLAVNGKEKHIGLFDDLKKAIKARKEANIKYGYHENHGKNNQLN